MPRHAAASSGRVPTSRQVPPGNLDPFDVQPGRDGGADHGADLELRGVLARRQLFSASPTAAWRKRVKTGLQTAISQLERSAVASGRTSTRSTRPSSPSSTMSVVRGCAAGKEAEDEVGAGRRLARDQGGVGVQGLEDHVGEAEGDQGAATKGKARSSVSGTLRDPGIER